MKNVTIWLESSSPESFAAEESDDGKTISAWKDINPTSNDKKDATQIESGDRPVFSNTINSIHAVEFDGDNNLEIDGSSINGTDYTIHIVEKRKSAKADNYFVGDPDATPGDNGGLLLGYSANDTIIHSQGGSISYSSSTDTYSANEPRIFTFTQKAGVGKRTYINGILAASSSNTDAVSGITNVKIGKGYVGEIGKIIVSNKAMNSIDIIQTQEYLSKKWKIDSKTGTSCTNGAVIGDSCDINVCNISKVGSATTTVSEGSGNITCGVTGYSGTVAYTCTDGSLSSSETCGCASGYTLVSGTCQADCSVSITGSSASTVVSVRSGSLTCDATGYAGTVSYSCATGSLSTTTSCTCASDYSMVGGVCQQDCTFSSTAGITTSTTVAHAATSTAQTCNATGYTGSVNYTCNNGTISVTGTCTAGCGTISNGAGVTFDAAGLTSNSQYALAACESHYGSGNCKLGTCVGATFYHRSAAGRECTCSYPSGDYEWVYENSSNQVGGGGWGGQTTSTVGKFPFVRLKGSNTCNPYAWSLATPNLAAGCPGVNSAGGA